MPAPPAGDLANFLVVVDPDGELDECVESNNSAFALKAGCP